MDEAYQILILAMWEDPNSKESPSDKLTFLALKPRLTSLLMEAFEVETDAVNIQMLLGGKPGLSCFFCNLLFCFLPVN